MPDASWPGWTLTSARAARCAPPSRCYGWPSTIRRGAKAAVAPVLDGSLRVHPVWIVAAALLEAIAHDTLGDPGAAGRALERALDVAEPDLTLFPFLVHPGNPGVLSRFTD